MRNAIEATTTTKSATVTADRTHAFSSGDGLIFARFLDVPVETSPGSPCSSSDSLPLERSNTRAISTPSFVRRQTAPLYRIGRFGERVEGERVIARGTG